MAKERRKIVQAGSLWMAVQYTNIRGENQAARREAKSQISTPARESLNARTSWQKLMLLLAANFKSKDIVVTLTYRDNNLPVNREAADRRLTAFIRAFRAFRSSKGLSFIYIRVTEGYHSGGRLHHHLIFNGTGEYFDIIRSLWIKNGDNVEFEKFGVDGAERWAKYLTKEPREKGRRHVGDRSWRASIHMKKPVVSYEFVPSETDLSPPAGASVIEKTECQNSFGRFCHVVARLPESDK